MRIVDYRGTKAKAGGPQQDTVDLQGRSGSGLTLDLRAVHLRKDGQRQQDILMN